MYDTFSNYIIKKLIIKKIITFEDYDKVDFIIKAITSTIIISSLILTLGWLFDCILQTFIISIILNILKDFSFKYHMNPTKCTIFSMIYTLIFALISKYTFNYSMCIFFISIFLFIITLNNVPKVPFSLSKEIDSQHRKIYSIQFIILSCIYLLCFIINTKISIIIGNSILLGVISVEVFLTDIGFKLYQLYDNLKFGKEMRRSFIDNNN